MPAQPQNLLLGALATVRQQSIGTMTGPTNEDLIGLADELLLQLTENTRTWKWTLQVADNRTPEGWRDDTTGTLEDCLSELFAWHHGENPATQTRLISPLRSPR